MINTQILDDRTSQEMTCKSVTPATLTHVSTDYSSIVTTSGDLDLLSLSSSTGRGFDESSQSQMLVGEHTSQSTLSGTTITEKGSILYKDTKAPASIGHGDGCASVPPVPCTASSLSSGHETRRRRQWRVRSSCTDTVKRKPLKRYGQPGLDEVFVGELKSCISQLLHVPDSDHVPAPCNSGLKPTDTCTRLGQEALKESTSVEVESGNIDEVNNKSFSLTKLLEVAPVSNIQRKSTDTTVEGSSLGNKSKQKSRDVRVELNKSSSLELQKKSTDGVELRTSSSDEISTKNGVELRTSSSDEISTKNGVELRTSSSDEISKKNGVELRTSSSDEISTKNGVELRTSSSDEISTKNGVELRTSSSDKTSKRNGVELRTSSSDETSKERSPDAKGKPRRCGWRVLSATGGSKKKLPRYEVDDVVELELLFRGLSLDDVTLSCPEVKSEPLGSSSSHVAPESEKRLCGYKCGSSISQKTTGSCICDDCWTDDDDKLDLNNDHFYNRESAMSILDIPWEFDLSDPNMPNPCPPTCICKRGRRDNIRVEKILGRGKRTTVSLYKKLLDKRLLSRTNKRLYSCCKEECFHGWFPYSFAKDLLWEYGPSDLRVCHFRWGEWKPSTESDAWLMV